MAISRREVEKVSLLARLLLSDDELDQMTVQLSQILQYIELLNEVDTEHIEPMTHAVELTNVLRPDEVQPGLARDQALANAPHADGECYLVPAVLGEL